MIRIDRSRLLAHVSAATRARRELALDLLEVGLAAVDPEDATARALGSIDVSEAFVFAVGKAAAAMTRGAIRRGARRGIVIARSPEPLPAGFEVHQGGHPDPALDAIETARKVLRHARAMRSGQRALCLISGGASAMLTLPAEGIGVETLTETARVLRERGASIGELNSVRCALDVLKAGGLAREIAPADVLNVILSDTPGQGLHLVGSGPTMAPSPSLDPQTVLARHGLTLSLPATDPNQALPAIETRLAADGTTAVRAIVKEAEARGLRLRGLDAPFSGEARDLAARLPTGSWVASGETTVTVAGDGRGGRNQELALAALPTIGDAQIATLGTDGVDGSSDAAGALVDSASLAHARRLGLDLERHLADNDSHTFFDALGTALRTGPTGTNVADLMLRLE